MRLFSSVEEEKEEEEEGKRARERLLFIRTTVNFGSSIVRVDFSDEKERRERENTKDWMETEEKFGKFGGGGKMGIGEDGRRSDWNAGWTAARKDPWRESWTGRTEKEQDPRYPPPRT